MSGEEEENAAELKIVEVALILEHKYELLQQMSDDPMNQLCVLGNLCPETVEEAIAMVPSIKTKGWAHDDDAIEKMLNDLTLMKKFE
ncbi:hypothetical protein CRYUN_Cryun15aG0083600 [Craigia yunnanensis]